MSGVWSVSRSQIWPPSLRICSSYCARCQFERLRILGLSLLCLFGIPPQLPCPFSQYNLPNFLGSFLNRGITVASHGDLSRDEGPTTEGTLLCKGWLNFELRSPTRPHEIAMALRKLSTLFASYKKDWVQASWTFLPQQGSTVCVLPSHLDTAKQ